MYEYKSEDRNMGGGGWYDLSYVSHKGSWKESQDGKYLTRFGFETRRD